MDDGCRDLETRAPGDAHLAEPMSVSDDTATLRFNAPERTRFVPSHPAKYWVPVTNAAMSVAIIDRHSFTRECIAKSLQECDDALAVAAFESCDSCFASATTYDLILYHAHGAALDPKQAGRAPFDRVLQLAPVVVLSDLDCPDAIMDAFECGARGYIPTIDTTLGLALEIVRLIRAGGTFVPPSSLALRRASRRDLPPASAPAATPAAAAAFTPRQMAVLRQVKLGKANKTIARELEMSESTVKIHLRNIMKKMKAANRTEVACRAHALETSQLQMVAEQG
jgi:DNA-binding NarL/FixJ family response regulator